MEILDVSAARKHTGTDTNRLRLMSQASGTLLFSPGKHKQRVPSQIKTLSLTHPQRLPLTHELAMTNRLTADAQWDESMWGVGQNLETLKAHNFIITKCRGLKSGPIGFLEKITS